MRYSNSAFNKPIVGVFVSRKQLYTLNQTQGEFDSIYPYIRFVAPAKASQEVGVSLYFFSNQHVHLKQGKIRGTYFDHKQQAWKRKDFPLPDILYDRGGGGTPNKSITIREKFHDLGIKSINAQHYFDKWDLYEQLNKLKRMQPHLPFTMKGANEANVLTMLNKYGQVYVKACKGSCGKGVLRVIKLSKDLYQYRYFRGGRLVVEQVNKNKLLTLLRSFFQGHDFIVQQAIHLHQKGTQIIDMRGEVQRDARGNLKVIGTTVRLGRPHSPIASNTNHTDYYPLPDYLRRFVFTKKQDVSGFCKKVHKFLVEVYHSTEKRYGSFGELGIDFGVDQQGHLWLIECNAKSAKVALYRAYGEGKIIQSFCNPLAYARYLFEQ